MTAQERDYEEILGRVLHSATDQIEPVGDGLTKIRARLTEPWLSRQWWLLRSELMVLRWLLVVRCEALFSTARAGSAAAGPGSPDVPASPRAAAPAGRYRSLPYALGGISAWIAGRRSHKPASPAVAWLRPALAVAGAVALVVAGVFALGQIRQTFVGMETGGALGTTSSNSSGGNGSTNGGGSALRGSSASAQGTLGGGPGQTGQHNRATPAPTSCVSASPPPVNSPTPTPTPTSASPSPTPTTASPSPTPTTASPTPSSTGAAGPGPGGYHTQAPIRTTALVMCGPTPSPQSSPTTLSSGGP